MNIYYVDDDHDQRETFARYLSSAIEVDENSPKIVAIDPMPVMGDMEFIVGDSAVAVVLDERLISSGTVQYLGLDLAAHLRALNPKIPMYILTSYYDQTDKDLTRAISVEGVLNKNTISDSFDELKMQCARILRAINTYTEISSERSRRFEELLRKRYLSQLTEPENSELGELAFLRERAGIPREILEKKQCEEIDMLRHEIEEIERQLKVQ